MSQGDEFKFRRGAAAHPEREQGIEGGQKREHADDGMTAAPETLCFPGFWNFEQAQPGKLAPAAHGFSATRQNASICKVPRVHMGNVG